MFITWILIEVYRILLASLFYHPVNNSVLTCYSLFYLPVNNSVWTCYYQLQGILFHLRLHLVFSIKKRLAITNYHDNHLIMRLNSHWNMSTCDLLSPTTRAIIPVGDFILCSVRTSTTISTVVISHCIHLILCSFCGYHQNW